VVARPEFLIADEPTGNLDPALSAEIMTLFEAFNQVGVTVLVATHDVSLIARTDHRLITLAAGQITQAEVA
jgi:cell division transport system ATP-binding protein